ncbi:MAG: hypothetical protein NTY36_01485 [Deltaproteobacteria bacterium]|nr:hypothetical protein [Deltaproteobacteria bacterium]
MKGSFNDRLRQVIAIFPVGQTFTSRQAGDLLELCTDERRNRLGGALKDLAKYGELEHLGPGRWRRLGREERPELKEIMWNLQRIHLVLTAEEMSLQSGASPHTVRDWYKSMLRLGLVRNEAGKGQPGRYRLIKDLGPKPPADSNGERLRQLRARRRQQEALASLDGAFARVAQECPGKNGESLRAIAQARLAVSRLEE